MRSRALSAQRTASVTLAPLPVVSVVTSECRRSILVRPPCHARPCSDGLLIASKCLLNINASAFSIPMDILFGPAHFLLTSSSCVCSPYLSLTVYHSLSSCRPVEATAVVLECHRLGQLVLGGECGNFGSGWEASPIARSPKVVRCMVHTCVAVVVVVVLLAAKQSDVCLSAHTMA